MLNMSWSQAARRFITCREDVGEVSQERRICVNTFAMNASHSVWLPVRNPQRRKRRCLTSSPLSFVVLNGSFAVLNGGFSRLNRWFRNLNRGARALSGRRCRPEWNLHFAARLGSIVGRHCLGLHQRFKMKETVVEPISILWLTNQTSRKALANSPVKGRASAFSACR